MEAKIAVGVKLALVLEDADFVVADEHDPPIAILEFRKFCDEFFRHMRYCPRAAPIVGLTFSFFGPAAPDLRRPSLLARALLAMHLAQTAPERDRGSDV
jgi:hypothetical protein